MTPTPEQLQAAKDAFYYGYIDNEDPNHAHLDVLEWCVNFTAKALGETSSNTYEAGDAHITKAWAKGTIADADLLFEAMIQQICEECAE